MYLPLTHEVNTCERLFRRRSATLVSNTSAPEDPARPSREAARAQARLLRAEERAQEVKERKEAWVAEQLANAPEFSEERWSRFFRALTPKTAPTYPTAPDHYVGLGGMPVRDPPSRELLSQEAPLAQQDTRPPRSGAVLDDQLVEEALVLLARRLARWASGI